jgi:taurine--2-oxoglutarate transaminase
VVGTNGIIVPPKEYMPRLRQIANENGVIFIVDEVMSGWFRTGKWFAINHWNVVPDILTTAKGSTGAYVPLGITATKREIREHFEERYFPHGHTYAAHPMTLAPVMAAVEEYKKLDQSGHMSRVSQYLAKRLEELKSNHKCVGDVRGLGHFWAVEIVKNRETKEPFNTRADKAALKPLMTDRISVEAQKKGVYITGWVSHLIIAPPLIITEEQIDEGVNVLDEALKIADQEAT